MKLKFCLFLLMIVSSPLCAQEEAASVSIGEPLSFIGMRLSDLFERFGMPALVFAVRGNEAWQDDIVFRYAAGDFYIYRDRVWQVRLSSAMGISAGDPRQAVVLVMGDRLIDNGTYMLMEIPSRNWPLMLRVNINNTGRVSEIFIYRPDY